MDSDQHRALVRGDEPAGYGSPARRPGRRLQHGRSGRRPPHVRRPTWRGWAGSVDQEHLCRRVAGARPASRIRTAVAESPIAYCSAVMCRCPAIPPSMTATKTKTTQPKMLTALVERSNCRCRRRCSVSRRSRTPSCGVRPSTLDPFASRPSPDRHIDPVARTLPTGTSAIVVRVTPERLETATCLRGWSRCGNVSGSLRRPARVCGVQFPSLRSCLPCTAGPKYGCAPELDAALVCCGRVDQPNHVRRVCSINHVNIDEVQNSGTAELRLHARRRAPSLRGPAPVGAAAMGEVAETGAGSVRVRQGDHWR